MGVQARPGKPDCDICTFNLVMGGITARGETRRAPSQRTDLQVGDAVGLASGDLKAETVE